MTQGLKSASEQAQGVLKIMAVKTAKKQLSISKNFLNINYTGLLVTVTYFVSGSKTIKMLH